MQRVGEKKQQKNRSRSMVKRIDYTEYPLINVKNNRK